MPGQYRACMSASLELARAVFRRHGRGLLGLAVVLALGIGLALASLEAARRTDSAYPSYLRRAEVGELVVNPNLNPDRGEEIISSTPGVSGYVSDSWLTVTPDEGHPRTQSEVYSIPTQVRVSADGRYTDQDRPAVHEGRMVGSGAEAFVSVETAKALDLKVGDRLPLAFWRSYAPPAPPPPEIVAPIGRVEVEVVGIGVFADEVLVDGLYPRQRILVSPDVGSDFDCTLRLPSADDPRPLEELGPAIIPGNCAMSYRQFSLRVDGGDSGVAPLMGALAERLADEDQRLPAALRESDIAYSVIPSVTAEVRQRVQRSLDPAVRALQLFALAVGVATLVVTLLGAVRLARGHEADARIWRHLGAVRLQQVAGVAAPLAVAASAGLAGSLVVGWLGSSLGPLASARAVEPPGRLGLSPPVVLTVLGASAAVLAVGLVLAAGAVSRSTPGALARRTPRGGIALSRSTSPWLALGGRAALGGPGAGALLGASVVAVTAILATSAFTASLDALVSDGDHFGWPYDAAVMVGEGYGGADVGTIAATLDRPDVRSWGLAALPIGIAVNGERVPVVAGRAGFDDVAVPVIEGERPIGDDEIGLGALTAKRMGVGVGDRVEVSTADGERAATVRGLVVLPPIGPFEADRTSLGTGALLPARFLEAALPDPGREAGAGSGEGTEAQAEEPGTFVAIDLVEGTDREGFVAAISDELPTWDLNRFIVLPYADPVRPPQIADVAAMRAVPGALVGVFALAMAGGLAFGITVATRSRRRELAVLRALGATGRQLRASVQAQSLTVVSIGLGVGLPLGIALGRASYRAFATGLGALPEPVVSLQWTLVTVAATLAVGLVAAARPGHRVARATAAAVLRHE